MVTLHLTALCELLVEIEVQQFGGCLGRLDPAPAFVASSLFLLGVFFHHIITRKALMDLDLPQTPQRALQHVFTPVAEATFKQGAIHSYADGRGFWPNLGFSACDCTNDD